MEFERTLFKIYQRVLLSEAFRRLRLQAERALPFAIAPLLLALAGLHAGYVGRARCLPHVLQQVGLWNATTGTPTLPEDAMLSLAVVDGEDLLDTGVRLHMPVAASLDHEAVNVTAAPTAAAPAAHAVASITPAPGSAVAAYRFALDREVASLRPTVFHGHHFQMYNISISEGCLAPVRPLRDAFRLFGALDGIVINELAYTFRSRGYLLRMEEGEEAKRWAWSLEQIEATLPVKGRSPLAALVRKLLLVVKACSAFVLISAITGLFIRVVVAGSVILIFAVAFSVRSLCPSCSGTSIGTLVRTFPWIGLHVDTLLRARRPLKPLFRSHLVFLFFQCFAYLSCNLAWRFILYRKYSPEGFEDHIFNLCSVLEIFNLIFVRSAESVSFFPRAVFLSVSYLHFYIFCSLYPFHTLALTSCAAVCVYAMVYALNHFEDPALRGDPVALATPTAAHPRGVYVPQLSPSWAVEQAPLWTMFYPPEPPSAFPQEAVWHLTREGYRTP